jgi:hypothetical protein
VTHSFHFFHDHVIGLSLANKCAIDLIAWSLPQETGGVFIAFPMYLGSNID